MTRDLPPEPAQVTVVGAGAIGLAAAYYAAKGRGFGAGAGARRGGLWGFGGQRGPGGAQTLMNLSAPPA